MNVKAIFVVVAVVASASAAAAADEQSLQAARDFAAQTLSQMKPHHHDVLGGRAGTMSVKKLKSPKVDLPTLRAAMSSAELDVFSISASAFTLGTASPADADAAVEALLRQMNRAMFADPDTQHHLIVALGARAVPALLRHLNDSMVLGILGDIGPEAKSAVPALKAILGTRNVEAAKALVEIGTDDAVAAATPVLQRVAADPFDPWAKAAAIALGETGRRSAQSSVPILRRLLAAPDSDTRMYSAFALARLGDTETAAKALGTMVRERALDDPFPALAALTEMGTAALPARDDLIALTLDAAYGKSEHRAEAATALAKIAPRDPKVVSALRAASADLALTPLLTREVMALVPRQ